MIKPIVSVIIPLYNQKDFVSEAIESVLCQTFRDFEIIVVNDGSTDFPETVLEKYKDKIKVIYQENKGLAAARNTGVRVSKGDFIQFLDADDVLLPEKIQRQMKIIENYEADIDLIPYCSCIRVHNKDINEIKDFEYQKVENMSVDAIMKIIDLWSYFPFPIHTTLIKRTIIEKIGFFDESMNANEDRLFWTKVALNSGKFVFDNTYSAKYRKHDSSMTCDNKRMFDAHMKYLGEIENILDINKCEYGKLRKKLLDVYLGFFINFSKIAYSKNHSKDIMVKIKMLLEENHFANSGKLRYFFIKLFGIDNYLRVLKHTGRIK